MNKELVLKKILEIGICPVVRAPTASLAMEAVGALAKGGIPIAEITMTVPGAIDVIRNLRKSLRSEVIVGAGTVLDETSARQCIEAGAQFVVSPGFDLQTVAFAKAEGILMLAGALTPTEIITAWKAGADMIKIFPCGNLGGPRYIKALKGPLPQIPLVPTGGVTLENIVEFFRAGATAVGIGGELVSPEALASGRFNEITETAERFLRFARERHGN